jgi:hypothetical protein
MKKFKYLFKEMDNPDTPSRAAMTLKEKPNKEPIKKLKEENDTSEKNEMAQTQLHFINYASKEILDYIEIGGEIEEWYQNKLSKVQSEVESLHSYIEGEKRRTGMVDEAHQVVAKTKDGESFKSAVYPTKKQAMDMHYKMAKGNKYAKVDTVKVQEETLEEGRPSQRHPLEGHEYHKKTDAELIYIAKDAHKAAEAMKSHNTTAENKYRDQANDSATVRYFRQKNGMPDWYKKKYGHMKEEFEQIDELSKDTLKSYMGKAAKENLTSLLKPGMIAKKQAAKRFIGMQKAGEKMAKEDIEQLEEKNVPTSPEKWAQAKSQAKAKFDVYPSAYANGWAAKKYKEMGGGWKSVNEESELDEDLRNWFDPKHPEGGWKRINSKGEAIGPCAREEGEAKPKCMSNEKRASLTKKERASAVRAKRKHDSDPERKGEPINVSNYGKGKISEQNVPFEGPYSKSPSSVTDKSGAKHTPMSRVKHLARQALNKQKEKMIPMKPVKESKKIEIVRDAAKKKKEVFNPEPELSSNITKT